MIIGLKKTAVLCILRHRNQFLLLQRAKEPHKDEYIPIGGKIEQFEDPLSATVWEVFEEIGLKLNRNDIQFIGMLSETSSTKFNWINFVYYAEIDFFESSSYVEGNLHWINKNDISLIPMPKTDLFFFRYLEENKPFMLNATYDENLNLKSLTEEITKKELI